ncbi:MULTISPECIES: PAS domain-containing protein [Qipengyuania]|uniref:PAS domain S-box-containing protein n=1 Tax=Qipengyuania nanhaisediminis TaxID=604088 RepID=A0A1I5Q5I4_9SPHN|nr:MULTISPECIES: PAS domain-containing protein [Qipengyuania]MCA0902279.1 PAS domain-containing protein [Qipengyuania aquimaris]SFP41260.1 PAS domain S-box-containing protein [Qipengyuania nanhaisediminis]
MLQETNISAEPLLSPEVEAMRMACAAGLTGGNLALALLEQSEDCIKLLTLQGELDYMNCGGLRAMEISDFGEVKGQPWWSLWPQEHRDLVRESFNRAVSGHERHFTADCPTAAGTPRRWSVHLKPLVAPAGPVVAVLCTSRDITGIAQLAA